MVFSGRRENEKVEFVRGSSPHASAPPTPQTRIGIATQALILVLLVDMRAFFFFEIFGLQSSETANSTPNKINYHYSTCVPYAMEPINNRGTGCWRSHAPRTHQIDS
jgi:hypothetical protein